MLQALFARPVDVEDGGEEHQHQRAQEDADEAPGDDAAEEAQHDGEGRYLSARFAAADEEGLEDVVDGADHAGAPEEEDDGAFDIAGAEQIEAAGSPDHGGAGRKEAREEHQHAKESGAVEAHEPPAEAAEQRLNGDREQRAHDDGVEHLAHSGEEGRFLAAVQRRDAFDVGNDGLAVADEEEGDHQRHDHVEQQR